MAGDEVTVEVDSGLLRGRRTGELCVFRGVPYADDAGGNNRFKPPQDVKPWTGVRDALAFGPSAVQLMPSAGRGQEDPLSARKLVGEDCLALNIWTPELTGKRPVMVWFHGGGYTVGSASSPLYDGSTLAREGDAVVVSVNHRLGLLGFLHLQDVFGSDYAGSGNAGILDLIASLRWVRRNIERFGGNPDCVTLFGESGGGGKVSALLASPLAKGLFHRAIVQSGPPFQFPDRQAAAQTAEDVLKRLDFTPAQGPQRLLQCSAVDLLQVQVAMGAGGGPSPGGMTFAPVIDGDVLPDWPEAALSGGAASQVPLLIGTNLDEARFMLMMNPHLRKAPPSLSDDELLERVSPGCDRGAEALIASYRAMYPELSRFDLLLKIESEQFRVRSIRLAEGRLQGPPGAPVYMYLFSWTTPRLAKYGAYHGMELPFLFGTLPAVPHLAADPEAELLGRRIRQAWVTFADHGAPAAQGVAPWPAYEPQRRSTMRIDRRWAVEADPLGRERAAGDDVPTGPTTRPWSRVVA